MRGKVGVLIVVHGMFHVAGTLQMPPMSTSGELALGGFQVVKPVAPPHQLKPRRSFAWPWMDSASIMVDDVPSVIPCKCEDWPAGPRSVYLPKRSWSGWFWPYSAAIWLCRGEGRIQPGE